MKTRNILILWFAATALLLLNSCEPMEQNIVRDAEDLVLIPFAAETDAPLTKAEFSAGSSSRIVYSEGDKMIVYSTSSSTKCPVLPSMLNLVGGAGTKKGTFSGNIVLREGKTEADFNTWVTKYPDILKAIIIPAAGLDAGLFKWDATKHDLSIDFTAGALDNDLKSLVKRTVLFLGEVNYAEKKVTDITMGTSYVKTDLTLPAEKDWNTTGRDFTVTLNYDGVYGGYTFLTPTATLEGTCGGTSLIWSDWRNDETYEATGSFRTSGSTGGTLYIALLAAWELRYLTDEYEAYDKQSFTLTMENTGKGYGLKGGKIEAFAISRGKGYTRAVTLTDPAGEDILTRHPSSVRTAIMTTKGADLNGDGRLTRYEAAQFSPSGEDILGLQNNKDLTDARFFQFFTSITDTGDKLFNGCSNLTSVCFPKSLKKIGQYAFSVCSSLKTVLWGDSQITHIGGQAFLSCSSLTSITLPETLTTLGGCAFENCSSLTFADLALSSVKSLMTGTFRGCSSLETVNLPYDMTSIGIEAFRNCTKLANITMPASLNRIRSSAFKNCSGLLNINLKSTALTQIEDSAFEDCSELTGVSLPATLTQIGAGGFRNCLRMTSINLEDTSLSVIYENAFRSCSALPHLTFPATLKDFGNFAFDYSGLTYVRFLGTTPPDNIRWVCIDQIKKIFVPSAAYNAYKTAVHNAKGSEYSSRVIGE